MTRFLVDAQLPPRFAWKLRDMGYVAEHVAERQLADATDGEIWPDAMRLDACIITKDDDFVHRKLVAKAGLVVVWVRVPNLRRCVLLSWFERALPK